jgi:hypothetical protein
MPFRYADTRFFPAISMTPPQMLFRQRLPARHRR